MAKVKAFFANLLLATLLVPILLFGGNFAFDHLYEWIEGECAQVDRDYVVCLRKLVR